MTDASSNPPGGNPGRGRFITFEGGEGTGKTTQISALASTLKERGIDVVTTREPGGSPEAEAIRNLLVTGDTGRWRPATEALLHYAARNEHLERVVRPALESGAWVLSDRFSDSTMAYQGVVQGLGPEYIEALDKLIVDKTQPDLTLILDLDSEEGLSRAGKRTGNEDRYERMGDDFHRNLRQAFLDIAASAGGRCTVIDAAGTIDEVRRHIWNCVRERFDLNE